MPAGFCPHCQNKLLVETECGECGWKEEVREQEFATVSESSFFRKSGRGFVKYILLMSLVGLIVSALIVFLAVWVFSLFGVNLAEHGPEELEITVLSVLSAVLLVPFLETLVQGLMIRGLQMLLRSPHVMSIITALIWAGLHSLVAPAWGIGTFFPFFVFSMSFIAWSEKKFIHGIWIATSIHGLINLAAISLVLIGGSLG